MHQTTVRFGSDLWSALEVESARLRVGVARYVRDAALARLSYTEDFEHAHPGGSRRGPSPADRR